MAPRERAVASVWCLRHHASRYERQDNGAPAQGTFTRQFTFAGMSFQAEIPQERLPVWDALSEFFLDTELQESDYHRISDVLARSPYTLTEIEEILRYEVYPPCHYNLLTVAGEWGGFDEQWLVEKIAPLCGKRPQWRTAVLHAWMFKRHWAKIQPMIDEIRNAK